MKEGHARKLSKEEREKVSSRTLYPPHHPMFNPKKADEVKFVYDAAVNKKVQSIISALCTGPYLLNSLMGVLLRFQNNNIAIFAILQTFRL